MAAPRTGPSAAVTPAVAETDDEPSDNVAAQNLVGAVVANTLVSRYVRDAVIESDDTIMALTTSAPTSLIEVVSEDGNAETD
jgi:hypothetical protein